MGFADPVDYIVVSFEGDYAMLRKGGRAGRTADTGGDCAFAGRRNGRQPRAPRHARLHLTVTKLRSDL